MFNYQILSAEIVRRVQHSPDSAHNLAETVAGLIRAEQNRDLMLEHSMRLETMKEADKRRTISGGDFYQAEPDASASDRRLLISERTVIVPTS